MAKEFSGAGDPGRTLAILWGAVEPPGRGPKPRLRIGQIVEAATAIADADGLDALSMRRVAEDLGVGTMSLYSYVPSKAELIDAMLDAAYADIARLGEQHPRERPMPVWRASLERIAEANRSLYQRHPWMLQIFTGRPTLGPNAIARYEVELSAVEGIGLTDVEMDAVITLLHTHVEGMARRKVDARQAEQRTGITDQQWWAAAAPVLSRVFDADRFPLAARVGAAAGNEHNAAHDPDHAYRFGLERLLDGVGALIAERATRPSSQTGSGDS